MRYGTAEKAVSLIESGNRVFIQGMGAAPHRLIHALVSRASELRDVELVHLHTEGPALYADAKYSESFFVNSMFVGSNIREAVDAGRADYVPVFLSEVPDLFRRGVLPIDVAMVHVSPPDRHGYCSLGVSVDATLAAVESARMVIAQVNPRMPRTHGDGQIAISRFELFVLGVLCTIRWVFFSGS